MTAPIPKGELYEQLERLINDAHDKEEDCREYLQHVARFLFNERKVVSIRHFDKEIRLMTGDMDFAVSGIVSEGGVECLRAYLWELKAPQCAIFTRDIEGRLIPTKSLFEAENQLLHYFFEAQGNDDFRQGFGGIAPNNVRIGGIIISCEKRKVATNVKKEKKRELYEKAYRTREQLYLGSKMRLVLWDEVLEQLREPVIGKDAKNPNPTVIEAPIIPPGTISSF
jgi:hypothetical protein